MAANKTSQKLNIPMLVACVLLCLTMLSLHLTAGLYARYTTSGQAEDAARVAAFKVTESDSILEETIAINDSPGSTEYEIKVTNESETAIRYTVSVENVYHNLPLQFSMDGGSTFTPGSASFSTNMAVGQTSTINIVVNWPQDGATAYVGMTDMLRFTVEAVQID